MTFTGAFVVFTSVSFISAVPVAAALLMPVTAARLHANVVPVVGLEGVYVSGVPLHVSPLAGPHTVGGVALHAPVHAGHTGRFTRGITQLVRLQVAEVGRHLLKAVGKALLPRCSYSPSA